MSDPIDRQAAIDALHMHLMYRMGTDSNKKRLDDWINGVPSVQPENQVHLCDSCRHVYPECPSGKDDVIFGNGKGNDNICACNKYEPSAQPEQHWIPCGEKLPEEDVRSYAPYDEHLSAFVLVTLKGQTWPYKKLTVKLARYSYTYNEWKVPNNNLGVVTAWMPLPKPYKAESEG